jgi:hypothetical protein
MTWSSWPHPATLGSQSRCQTRLPVKCIASYAVPLSLRSVTVSVHLSPSRASRTKRPPVQIRPPNHKTAGHTVSDDLLCAFRLSLRPVLGAKGERTGLLAGRMSANSRLSNGTADTGDSAAR